MKTPKRVNKQAKQKQQIERHQENSNITEGLRQKFETLKGLIS